jgi:hypothetical protein
MMNQEFIQFNSNLSPAGRGIGHGILFDFYLELTNLLMYVHSVRYPVGH